MIPRVALVTVTGRGGDMAEHHDYAADFARRGRESLEGRGLGVIADGHVCRSPEDVMMAALHARDAGAQAIIYQATSWFENPLILSPIREVELPTALWTVPCENTFALVGGACARGALDEIGLSYRWVYGAPEDSGTLDELIAFAKGAMVVAQMKVSRYGYVGGQSLGMYTTTLDYAQVMRQFGLNCHHADQLELYLLAGQEPADRVAGVRESLSVFGRIDSPEDVVDRSIRVYLALKDMARDYGYSFIGVKCQPEMIYRYASCCLAMSLLGNEGIPTACECDTNAALTMYMLHLLSGQAVYFGDTASLDLTTREFKVVNCGGAPTDFAAKPEGVVLGTQYEIMGSGRGVVTTFQCRPGELTLARISRVKGKFVVLLARGAAEEREPDAFVESFKNWPHAFIRLSGDPRPLVREIRSNHIHFVYGDHVAAMVEASRLLGIEATVV